MIEAEARVAFTVGEAKKNRRMGRKGILVLEARLIQSERLGVIPVQGRIDSEGAGHKATAAALTYTLGPLGLLKRGKPAELPAGAIYQVTTVSGNVETFTSVRNSRRQQ